MTDVSTDSNFKQLFHQTVISVIQEFASEIDDLGVCKGIIAMWLQAVSTSKQEENNFYVRFDDIAYYTENNLKTQIRETIDRIFKKRADNKITTELSEEEISLIEIRSFSENVAIQQTTAVLETSPFISQRAKDQLFSITASNFLIKNKLQTNTQYIGMLSLTRKEIENYFTALENTLIGLNMRSIIGFEINSDNHDTGVYFDLDSKKWHHLDINTLSGKLNYYSVATPKELADLLFDTASILEIDNLISSDYCCFFISTFTQGALLESIANYLKNITNKYFTTEVRKNHNDTDQLYLACIAGDMNVVQQLLAIDEIKQTINTIRPVHKRTPLFTACSEGNFAIAEELLKQGAAVIIEEESDDKMNPLHAVCQIGHLALVKLMLQYLPIEQINNLDDRGMSALWHACWGGHIAVVQCLIESGANVSIKAVPFQHKGNFLLLDHIGVAAYFGHDDIAQVLKNKEKELKIERPVLFSKKVKAKSNVENFDERSTKKIKMTDTPENNTTQDLGMNIEL